MMSLIREEEEEEEEVEEVVDKEEVWKGGGGGRKSSGRGPEEVESEISKPTGAVYYIYFSCKLPHPAYLSLATARCNLDSILCNRSAMSCVLIIIESRTTPRRCLSSPPPLASPGISPAAAVRGKIKEQSPTEPTVEFPLPPRERGGVWIIDS